MNLYYGRPEKVKEIMPIITKSEDVATLCQSLAAHEYITVDTEFLREKTYYPKLCLVQLKPWRIT